MLIAEGGMTAAGTHPVLVASVLEESRHLKLHCNYQELSTVTDFNCSLKQGGKESPPVFRDCVMHCLDGLVQQWRRLRFGIELGQGFFLTHLVWADNIYLYGSSRSQLMCMIEMVTDAIWARRLRWKPGSLEVLTTTGDTGTFKVKQGNDDLDIQIVDQMKVLGGIVDCRGCTMGRMNHRLAVAERRFWAERERFTSRHLFE